MLPKPDLKSIEKVHLFDFFTPAALVGSLNIDFSRRTFFKITEILEWSFDALRLSGL